MSDFKIEENLFNKEYLIEEFNNSIIYNLEGIRDDMQDILWVIETKQKRIHKLEKVKPYNQRHMKILKSKIKNMLKKVDIL